MSFRSACPHLPIEKIFPNFYINLIAVFLHTSKFYINIDKFM